MTTLNPWISFVMGPAVASENLVFLNQVQFHVEVLDVGNVPKFLYSRSVVLERMTLTEECFFK